MADIALSIVTLNGEWIKLNQQIVRLHKKQDPPNANKLSTEDTL